MSARASLSQVGAQKATAPHPRSGCARGAERARALPRTDATRGSHGSQPRSPGTRLGSSNISIIVILPRFVANSYMDDGLWVFPVRFRGPARSRRS